MCWTLIYGDIVFKTLLKITAHQFLEGTWTCNLRLEVGGASERAQQPQDQSEAIERKFAPQKRVEIEAELGWHTKSAEVSPGKISLNTF